MKKVRPAAGQESVWDYPRPPRLESTSKTIRVWAGGELLAETSRAMRMLETSHPPVYYLPPGDVRNDLIGHHTASSFCEWKGQAHYVNVKTANGIIQQAGWFYPQPVDAYRQIKDYLAFYPSKMDSCKVDDEVVQSQPGDFYGGWITSDIVGPFKGTPGTWHW